MAKDWQKLWNELSEIQQKVLLAIYKFDQKYEALEKKRSTKWRNSRSANEWRWVDWATGKYANEFLWLELRRLFNSENYEKDAFIVFKKLEVLGYISIRWHDEKTQLQMIPAGRRLLRNAGVVDHKPTRKRFKGQLRKYAWELLVNLYHAGDYGIELHSNTTTHRLCSEFGYAEMRKTHWRLYITEKGRQHYEEFREEYARSYPEMEAER